MLRPSALALWLIAALGCLGAGCSRKASQQASAPPPFPPVAPEVVHASNAFGLSLLKELRAEQPAGNALLSPVSVAMALHMAYNGAGSTTKEAMAKVLGVESMALGELNGANLALRQGLSQPGPGVKLTLANSMWWRTGYPFAESFLRTNDRYYAAHIEELHFGSPQAAPTMNAWVREATEGCIEGIVDEPIDPLATLFILNAAYFLGEWTDPFDEAETTSANFRLADGNYKPVHLMCRDGQIQVARGKGYRAAHLPYSTGRFGMQILLPDRDKTVDDAIAAMEVAEWDTWVDGAEPCDLHLELPRFRVQFGVDLEPPLTALGMGVAFDPDRADFVAMQPNRPQRWVGEAEHKASIEVNEEGTEAAAATEVVMYEGESETAGDAFIVDRPFVCAIRDNDTRAILFLGAILDPEAL